MYTHYAPIYELTQQGRFGAHMAEWTLHWLGARGERVARVLDLACGTGSASLVFAQAGCAVVGVDTAAAMLQIARDTVQYPRVTWVQTDMRHLADDAQGFDLVTCFSDSINYLTEDDDLEQVFSGVARVLRPGGYLVFDLNTEAEFATWDQRDVVTYDGGEHLVYNRLEYDHATRLATGRIVWFTRAGGRWWRAEETHTERAWSEAEIHSALQALHPAAIERLPFGDEPAAEARRVVYVVRRSSSTGTRRAAMPE